MYIRFISYVWYYLCVPRPSCICRALRIVLDERSAHEQFLSKRIRSGDTLAATNSVGRFPGAKDHEGGIPNLGPLTVTILVCICICSAFPQHRMFSNMEWSFPASDTPMNAQLEQSGGGGSAPLDSSEPILTHH